MTTALNTNVNGSSGTCFDAMDWSLGLHKGTDRVIEAVQSSQSLAENNWSGPAADNFLQFSDSPKYHAETIEENASAVATGLGEFARCIDRVSELMAIARTIATDGGLLVEGPFIIKPQQPVPPTRLTGSSNPVSSPDVLRRNRQEQDAHNEALGEYNAQAQAYNSAKQHVSDARELEEEAHRNLRNAMKAVTEGLTAGGTVYGFATNAAAYTNTAESGRLGQLEIAERMKHTANLFNKAAMGELVGTLTPAQVERIQKAADSAGKNRDQALKRAKQFDTFLKGVHPDVRAMAAAYPGKGSQGLVKKGHAAAPQSNALGKTLKTLPYVGSLLTIGNEAYGAASGEQTWSKAIVDSSAQISGGAVGAAFGVKLGAFGGPPGMLIGGLGGGILGGIGGQEVADFLTGD